MTMRMKSCKGHNVSTAFIITLLVFLIGGAVALFFEGCTQRTIRLGYDSAAVSKETYEVALSTLGDLYKQGLVDEATKDEAIEYGRVYKEMHNQMVEALAQYVEDKTNESCRQAYLNAAINAHYALARLLELLGPYLVEDTR